MSKYDDLEKGALEFTESSALEKFELEDLAQKLIPSATPDEEKKFLRTRLLNILDSIDLVARTRDSGEYVIRENFFKGTVFYCRPRPFELKQGILLSGARFEPFHPAEIFADELEIEYAKEKTLETKEFKCPYSTVSELYFILGPAGTLDMLSAESQENYESIHEAGGLRDTLRVEQTVFDMEEFYAEHSFADGDMLKFEIVSYLNGKMKVSHVPASKAPDEKAVGKWITRFESALAKVCADYRDALEIPSQMMYAYVYAEAAGDDIRYIPAPPIDMYHTLMRDISFRREGPDWLLSADDMEEDDSAAEEHSHEHGDGCSCGHDHSGDAHGKLSEDDFSSSKGALDSLDAILTETHAKIHEIELHALMLSAIANGAEDFDEFMRRNEEFIPSEFADDAQEAAFMNFTEDLWENVFERYSHDIDSKKAPLRERLLELMRKRIDLSILLLEKKDDALTKEFSEGFQSIHRAMIDTLAVLNADAVLDGDEEFEALELRVGDIEDDFDVLSSEIDSRLGF